LIVDATCAPADIRFPTDISLLNESRENAEKIIDFLYDKYRSIFEKKPRDYRQVAHKDFIIFTKKRKPRSKVRRKALKKQLAYLKRDIRLIDEMMTKIEEKDGVTLDIPNRLIERLKVITDIYSQQSYMYQNKINKVDDRIVSVTQPHIRPIVRGKAGKSTEFGAKISLSVSGGFCFIDHLSWSNFNESKDLISQIKKYKERFGFYPESVHADKIYQTRENRDFCKEKNIRITGKPLGRPPKVTEENQEKLKSEKKQRYQDDIDRIAVEGRFGVAKRRYGLGLIKSKLQETSETDINLSIFVLNLDKICSEELAEIRNRYKIMLRKAS
jgi:transposase, IS5 family